MRAVKNIVALLLISSTVRAQFYSLPQDHAFNLLTERQLAPRDSTINQGIQPYLPAFDKRHHFVADTHTVFRFIKDDPAIDLIFRRHFIDINPAKERFRLYIDPLLNLEAGRDLRDSSGKFLYTNTRGVVAGGTIGDDFYFETLFSENQSVFPSYIADTARMLLVVPGQGRWKTFKTSGFDYAFASSVAGIQLGKHFHLRFGHGKHKIGHGYRSLLLGDNGFVYPFARLSQSWLQGKIQYTNLFVSLMNLRAAAERQTAHTERLFQKKSAAFQYLELLPATWLQLSFFQGLVWAPGDSRNRQHLDWRFFNPVIFLQTANPGFSDAQHNITAGSDLLIKISGKVQVYAQGLVDRIDQNAARGCGWQAGLKIFDLLRVRHLTLQIERNETGKKAYTARTESTYDHYAQLLGSAAASCNEVMALADYRRHRFFTTIRVNSQRRKAGAVKSVEIVQARLGYVINPSYNLNVSLGFLGRRANFHNFGASEPNTAYVFFSVRTSLYNTYYDF